jgi:hypothetical protein
VVQARWLTVDGPLTQATFDDTCGTLISLFQAG